MLRAKTHFDQVPLETAVRAGRAEDERAAAKAKDADARREIAGRAAASLAEARRKGARQ